MNGPQNYAEALRILALAPTNDPASHAVMVSEAQVHAILALTAAIIDAHDNSADIASWGSRALALRRYNTRWEGGEDGEEITVPITGWARVMEQ